MMTKITKKTYLKIGLYNVVFVIFLFEVVFENLGYNF